MSSDVSFSPSAPGTAESAWLRQLDQHGDTHELDLDRYRAIVVLSAHPDDEVLGCGALMWQAVRAGLSVTVVLASWGEASHPQSPTTTAAQLAERRRGEMERALTLVGTPLRPIRLVALSLPDGGLGDHHHRLCVAAVDAITDATVAGAQVLVVAPWRRDGHPDHEAVGRAGAAAAARTDAPFREYPVWWWHWAEPSALNSERLTRVRASPAACHAKAEALAAHASQTSPLSSAPQDAAVLPEHVLAHFRRDAEIFVDPPAPRDYDAFETLHRSDEDPWKIDSAYERDKRRTTLGLLSGVPRPERVLEVGCSVGALTVELASVGRWVDALEPAPAAADLARRRTSRLPNVAVIDGAAPDGIPTSGHYDLVVLSEVGYFLSPRDLDRTLAIIGEIASPGGYLLACHWTGPVRGWPLDGCDVHRVIDDGADVDLIETRTDDGFLAQLWRVS